MGHKWRQVKEAEVPSVPVSSLLKRYGLFQGSEGYELRQVDQEDEDTALAVYEGTPWICSAYLRKLARKAGVALGKVRNDEGWDLTMIPLTERNIDLLLSGGFQSLNIKQVRKGEE